MTDIKTATEAQLREADVPWPKTRDELMAYVNSLVERDHDYGTCVYAMSMAATAAFYYVSSRLGVTGFQASCADMDILRRTRGYKMGFRLVDYGNLLYPQYCDDEHFPGWRGLMNENADRLRDEAKKLLAERGNNTHPAVLAHWEMVSRLPVNEPASLSKEGT